MRCHNTFPAVGAAPGAGGTGGGRHLGRAAPAALSTGGPQHRGRARGKFAAPPRAPPGPGRALRAPRAPRAAAPAGRKAPRPRGRLELKERLLGSAALLPSPFSAAAGPERRARLPGARACGAGELLYPLESCFG